MSDIWGLVSFFAGISLLAVGGGNATLPAISSHVVSSGWVTRAQFLQIYSLGQVAPGPSTMYVAGIGFAVSGWVGAVAAGLAFVVPSSILVVVAGTAWAKWPPSRLKSAVSKGLAPVTVALLAAGAWNLTVTLISLSDGTGRSAGVALAVMFGIAAVVAVLAQTVRISPAWLVLGSGALGLLLLS